MCRWAAYIGQPIFLEEILTAPDKSLIAQSRNAEECKTVTNGDGFGVAWYGHRPEPGLYRDALPAWSDANLRSVAAQVRSGLFLARVRASTGTATGRQNCHPFAVGRWSFMHNGQIGGYERLRREIDMMIDGRFYAHRAGTTDSEALFLIALGEGLETDPLGALARATGRLEALSRDRGRAPHVRMTAALSDGERLYVLRYATDRHAPSLYHRRSEARGGRAVVSEPLEPDQTGWEVIPPGSFATVSPEGVETVPFVPVLP